MPTSAAAEFGSVGGNLSIALGHLGKARFSAVSNGIEPDPSCEPLADLLDRALGKRGDIEVFADA